MRLVFVWLHLAAHAFTEPHSNATQCDRAPPCVDLNLLHFGNLIELCRLHKLLAYHDDAQFLSDACPTNRRPPSIREAREQQPPPPPIARRRA